MKVLSRDPDPPDKPPERARIPWPQIVAGVLLIALFFVDREMAIWLFFILSAIETLIYLDWYAYKSARFRTLVEYPDPSMIQQYRVGVALSAFVWLALGINGLFFHYTFF